MKIAVFGSAFDPPHIGHDLIVNTLLGNQLVDEVWLLPAKCHASGKSLVSEHHRLAMLKLVTRPGVKGPTGRGYSREIYRRSLIVSAA